ncbi:hypothetical protein AABB24_018049 [Solanum stoloniferum]|uniref:Uncharacterized protein n=1 Tax=Solanum stoloniferum TaxID=62892 RepID=A0ABD2TML5_9SOLN
MERKIEIVSMELIKPVSPTPNHFKCFEYSFLDQMAIPLYAPLALFYPPPHSNYEQAISINSSRLLVLKKSLSETLTRYYPFAGRIKGVSIECNDEGAPFYEAFAHNYEFLTKDFLPNTVAEVGSSVFHNSTLYPLLVQVTLFKCGGMVICMCAFHKVADGATLYGLANAWAIGSCNELPEFVAAAKFLPPPIPYVSNGPMFQFQFTNFYCNEQRVSKLFFFDASTIASLRAKAMSDDVPVPTRVEAVSALIWKCVITAGAGTGASKLANLVNMRRRFVPPLPDHCVGNVVAVATACKGENDDGSDLATLVNCIRKSLSQLSSKYVEKQSQDEAIFAIPYDLMEITEGLIRGEIALQVSSLCGYKSYVDFGWGKPSWVSSNPRTTTNNVRLMDSKDYGGIDALICLKDKDIMSKFQQEMELQLLPFGSVN